MSFVDILSNREWALLLGFSAFSLYLKTSPKMVEVRHSFSAVAKSFLAWKIQAVLLLSLLYVSFIVYLSYDIGLWNLGHLKSTIIWFFSVAFLSFFDIEKYKNDSSLFKRLVLDNVRIIALVEFLIGFYVLPFWAEIILLPILVVMTAMHVLYQTSDEYKIVEKLFGTILSLIGLSLIICSVFALFINFSDFAKQETIEDFALPPLLTLAYLPFIYFMVIYTTYENIFAGLHFSIGNKWVRRFSKIFAIAAFNLRVNELERWVWMLQTREANTVKDVFKAWRDLRVILQIERCPPSVSTDEGWSPFQAMKFLKSHNIKTGNYKELGGEWFACSQCVEFGQGLLPSTIAYYIDGTKYVAKSLKISISVNSSKSGSEARAMMLKAAESLFQGALLESLPKECEVAINNEEGYESMRLPHKISFKKDIWPSHRLGGNSLIFCISIPKAVS